MVAAVVTSHAGMLVARRNDGMPLWTFMTGEIESGESPSSYAYKPAHTVCRHDGA